MSTTSNEPNETSIPTLAIKEWCAGEIQWTRTYGLTAVISTRLDDEMNACIRCDVAGGSAFAEGNGEEKALEPHIASFQSFLDKNQDTIRRAYLYGLRRLDNTNELGAHDDDDLLLVSQDLVNLLPLLHSPDLPKMPRDGISYRFAYPEFFQFHENSFSESQQEDEVDETRLKLPLTRGRKVTETYLSKILDPGFVPNRPHRSAFWESGSKTEKTECSRRDFTAELYPIEVTQAETNHRKKLLEIRKRRNGRAKSAGRSPSRSSAGSRHSTRASSPSHSGPCKPDQGFGQHLHVPAGAPSLPLTQHTSDQLNDHTGNQHIVNPQASAYPTVSGNGATMTVDGDVWASWPEGTELGTYHTPTSEYNAPNPLTDTYIPQITSYVPQVLQTTPQVYGLTDPLPVAQPFLVNRTHLQTLGGPSVDLGKQAAADVMSYPTWDPSFEVDYGDYAVNTAGSSFTQSNNTPLSQASPYQASHSNASNQWEANPLPMVEYLHLRPQDVDFNPDPDYGTRSTGQESNVQSFEWPPVGSGQSLDPNLDDQQRRSHQYPPQ